MHLNSVLATLIVAASMAGPVWAQSSTPEPGRLSQEQQSEIVLARRQVERVRKAEVRRYRAIRDAQAARARREHEARMAPYVAQMQAQQAQQALEAESIRAQQMQAMAALRNAESMRRMALAAEARAWHGGASYLPYGR